MKHMRKKSAISSAIPVLLLLLLLAGSLSACSKAPQASPQSSPAQSPHSLFSIDPSEVSKIEIRGSLTNLPVTVTDRETIGGIVDELNKFVYIDYHFTNSVGWAVNVSIYNLENVSIDSPMQLIGNVVMYDHYTYLSAEAAYQPANTLGELCNYILNIYDSRIGG